jgi:hypothetical protein
MAVLMAVCSMGFHIVERCRFNFAQVVKSTR